jgi:tripartite-type tricarboxylate transporter receptor subunit TctC
MHSITRFMAMIAIVAIFPIGGFQTASADPVADFYRGKNVRLMIPSGFGGGLETYARAVSRHIQKYIPGKPTVVIISKPGGGGTVGAAYMYNAAPRDGSIFALALPASVLQPLLRKPKFDPTKFIWLGSLLDQPAVISVWHTAPGKTLEDAKNTQLIMGATGAGSNTYMIPALANALLGTKFKVVKGYKGGARINQAIEQGEVHGRAASWGAWPASKGQWLTDNKLRHLFQIGRKISALPNVPSFIDLVKTEEQRQIVSIMSVVSDIGVAFYLPPGVPRDRVAAMRTAFEKMLKDPAMHADAKRMIFTVNPVAADVLQAKIEGVFKLPKPIVAKFKAAMRVK